MKILHTNDGLLMRYTVSICFSGITFCSCVIVTTLLCEKLQISSLIKLSCP